jgi:hypothetical protein
VNDASIVIPLSGAATLDWVKVRPVLPQDPNHAFVAAGLQLLAVMEVEVVAEAYRPAQASHFLKQ